MKKLKTLLLMAMGMLLFSATTIAQVSASADASATILTPIEITNVSDMNFGNMAVDATPGTVVLTPAGTRTPSGGVTFLSANPGTVTAASFTVTGLADATYSITLPSGSTTISNGTDNMTVDTWTSDPTTATGGTLDPTGNQTLNVGATLTVPASSSSGVYTSGTPFEVTVNYN